MPLVDIKDRTPNQDTVRLLEKALEQAKSGELRSILLVKCWDDNSTTHDWSMDERSWRRMVLAEVVIAQTNLAAKISVDDGDTALAMLLE